MKWEPQPLWAGKEAFIIGGGSSLRTFDWNLIKGKLTIGCNAAYLLGEDVCRVCIFGDMSFFRAHEAGLRAFKGPIFTNLKQHHRDNISWLYTLERRNRGLHSQALGWNQNTGAMAINLALILGAKKIVLLGFDMKIQGVQSNWHDHYGAKNKPPTYMKFRLAFREVVEDWKAKFADREIINVNDDSDLEGFPKVPLKTFFEEARRIAS